MNSISELTSEAFTRQLFQQHPVEIFHLLYDEILVQINADSNVRERIALKWKTRMNWNRLPNDLWMKCLEWLTQYEYRCKAIHINQQCLRLARSRPVATNTSMYCRNVVSFTITFIGFESDGCRLFDTTY